MGPPNTGWVGKIGDFSTSRKSCDRDALLPKVCAHPRRDAANEVVRCRSDTSFNRRKFMTLSTHLRLQHVDRDTERTSHAQSTTISHNIL